MNAAYRHDEIAKLAYTLWELRGRPLGSPEIDWDAAERDTLCIPFRSELLGTGKRLFGDTGEMKMLRLAESKPVGDGVLILVYRPA